MGRLQNIVDMLNGKHYIHKAEDEVHLTAIGWNPDENTDCNDYREEFRPTMSGEAEYYRVIRKAKPIKQAVTVEEKQTVKRTVQPALLARLMKG